MDDIIRAGIRFKPDVYFQFTLDLSSGDSGVMLQLIGVDGEPITYVGSITWDDEGE